MYSDLTGNRKNHRIKSLWDNTCHADPPGISGWRVEGRIMYDAFILPNKADALFYKGNATVTA